MSEDRCICCGDIVPEGRMVCPGCEKKAEKKPDLAEELVRLWEQGKIVELIRCRECRWHSKEEGVCFHPHSTHLYTREDFYCAYGKRRKKTDEV